MVSLPAVSVFIPFIGALVIVFCAKKSEFLWKLVAVATSALAFIAVAAMYPAIKAGEVVGTGKSIMSAPFTFSFAADSLSFFLAAIFAFCYLIAVVYSIGYIAHGHAKNRYWSLLLVTEGTMLGVVLSGSLIGLFIFFELMAIFAYLLVIHEEDDSAMSAGSLFLYMSVAAGLAIFFGLAATFYLAGRLDFVAGGYIAASPLAAPALLALLFGFGVKAGMFPVHIWLPDAHPAAPAPFSALLSGCSIKVGVYGIIRVIFDVYGVETVKAVSLDQVMLVLAVITILLGSALALQQDHLKRRLAYSSVAQIGYVLLGISLMTERAMYGALVHIFSHALMKGTLFLCAGAIITQTGKKYISELDGIGLKMPVVMLSFTLASVTMVGIPPFNAFISKWNLALASLETGQSILLAVLMVSSLLNALYYFPIIAKAFLIGGSYEGKRRLFRDQLPVGMLWTTAVMAVLCVGFAFFRHHLPLDIAARIAASLF